MKFLVVRETSFQFSERNDSLTYSPLIVLDSVFIDEDGK